MSWTHLHRPNFFRAGVKSGTQVGRSDSKTSKNSGDEDFVSSDDEQAYDSAREEEENKKKQVAEVKADDEDELPWQVVAILDRETMRDMRYTFRCYEHTIKLAISGKELAVQPMLADKKVERSLLEVNAEPDFKQTGHRLQRVVKTIVDVRPPLVLHFMPRTVPMGGAK